MEQQGEEAVSSFDQFSRQQLEIYARELAEYVEREQALRAQLEQQNQTLEQRVRELTALNRLFQQHLKERFTALEAYHELHRRVQGLVKEADGLSEWLRSQDRLLEVGQGSDLPEIAPDG
jgi:predicted nuclease with TOPRIM domain